MERIKEFLDEDATMSLRTHLIIIVSLFFLGVIFALVVLHSPPQTEYEYVNYCDGNITSSETPIYTISEAIEEAQRVEFPLAMWGLFLLVILVILK